MLCVCVGGGGGVMFGCMSRCFLGFLVIVSFICRKSADDWTSIQKWDVKPNRLCSSWKEKERNGWWNGSCRREKKGFTNKQGINRHLFRPKIIYREAWECPALEWVVMQNAPCPMTCIHTLGSADGWNSVTRKSWLIKCLTEEII